MAERLISTTVDSIPYSQALEEVVRRSGTRYSGLPAAATALGVSVLTTWLSHWFAPQVTRGLEYLSVGLSFATVIAYVSSEMADNSDFENALNGLRENGSIRVTSRLYEWSSASGNHYTYYTRSTYTTINPPR